MKKLHFSWNELKTTFWFIPVLIIIFSILLSMGVVYLDSAVNLPQNKLTRFFLVNSADSARSILSTISGAMIGVAGTVFSVTLVAIFAAMGNIVLLIIFIHRIAISIQADKVISEISAFIATQVKALFPEKMGEEAEGGKSPDITDIKSGYSKTVSVKSPKSGYLQYIDSESLMEIITRNNALLELNVRPGGFLVEGLEIGQLHSYENIE